MLKLKVSFKFNKMGNVCNKKKSSKNQQKINLYVVNNRNGPVLQPQIDQNNQKTNHPQTTSNKNNFELEVPRDFKPSDAHLEFDSFRHSMSFLQEHKENKYSFFLFGEELSKVRNTFLFDLNKINDLTLKITRQELLLLSNENTEIYHFLKKNKIDVYSLGHNGSGGLNDLMNVSALKQKIQNRDMLRNQDSIFPEQLRLKYIKMIDKNILNKKGNLNEFGEESKFLNTTYDAGEYLEKEAKEILSRSNVLNNNGIILPIWDPDRFELCFDEDIEFKDNFHEFDQLLEKMAVENKVPFDRKGVLFMKNKTSNRSISLSSAKVDAFATTEVKPNVETKEIPEVLSELKPIVDDLKYENFYDKKIYAIMSSIINYDQIFETNLIKRLIFPQKEGRGYATKSGLHIVKLYINGCKRVFLVQSLDVYQYLTVRNEQYPHILINALKMVYPTLQKICPTVIMFRLCNWIPERMLVKDVGDVFTSYDKLKETFKMGNLILHWQESDTGKIRPVLDFPTSDKSMKRFIRTTKENLSDSESSFCLVDWEDLYNNEKIGNLYINWNPTIYSHRKTLHGMYWGNTSYKGGFDIPCFKLQRVTQFLLTMSPHKDVCETRVIIEKHKSALNINYRIKYSLFSFLKGRICLPHNSLREMEIKESEDEILSDILIFDENSNYESYVILLELTPENDADISLMKDDHFEVLSISLYTFADFDFLEIPYNNVENFIVSSPNMIASKDKPEPVLINDKSQNFISPYYKLSVLKKDNFEIRVDSNLNLGIDIVVMHYENLRKSITKSQTHLYKSTTAIGNNSLLLTLDEGTYGVKINFVQAKEEGEKERVSIPRKSLKTERFHNEFKPVYQDKNINFEGVQIHFLSFSENFAKKFEPLSKETKSKGGAFQSKMKVEQITLNNNLMNKKILSSAWTKISNYGTTKAKVNCFQKFMKNPGFVIRSEEQSEFKFRLILSKHTGNSALPYICISVFEIRDDFTFTTIIEDEDYVQGTEFTTEHLILKPNTYGYLVLCLTLEQNYQGSFDLEVISESKLKSFHDNRNGLLQFPYQEKFLGEISALSGGHISNPSFLLNDGYYIVFEDFKKEDKFFVEIVTGNTTMPVSIYLISSTKQSLIELSEIDINNYEYNAAFLYEVNSIFKPVVYSKYLIVPSSLKTLTESIEYELKVQSTCRFKLGRVTAPVFKDSFIIQQNENSENEVKFTLHQPDKVLVIVQPELKNIHMQMIITNKTTGSQIFQSYSSLQDGYIFKYLELFQQNHVFSLQIITNKQVPYSIKIYSMVENNIQII